MDFLAAYLVFEFVSSFFASQRAFIVLQVEISFREPLKHVSYTYCDKILSSPRVGLRRTIFEIMSLL